MSVAPKTPWYPETPETSTVWPAANRVQPICSLPPQPVAIHQAALLALLRSGEQSAGMAFGRIRAGLSRGLLTLADPALSRLIDDERRHDAALARQCERLPLVRATDAGTRRFFRGLESREPLVHLARVACLDACVCQVLTRVLASRVASWSMQAHLLLSGIRADEARHVKVSRALAHMTDADPAQLQQIDREVRHSFAGLLQSRTAAFEGLGIDMLRLTRAIRRDV